MCLIGRRKNPERFKKMGTCTSCCEAFAVCEYVDIADKVLWKELHRGKRVREWKVRRLLELNNASPNATQRNIRGQRDNVLHCAIRLGNFQIVDDIVTAGATVELPSDLYDTTPIQHAIKINRKDIIKFLVEMNINLSYVHNGKKKK